MMVKIRVKMALLIMVVLILPAHAGPKLAFLADEYAAYQYCRVPLMELRISHITAALQDFYRQAPEIFSYTEIGQSVERRPIYLVRMGEGATRILLWSQMHGDEPTATAALLDVFNYLIRKKADPFVQQILKNVTILAVPMLNPDGAAYFTRRNAQGLDVNRDARERVTPEGQILYELQQKYQPAFGFNLHDQDGRLTVGKTNQPVAIALMAPPFDESNGDNAVRQKAKQLTLYLYEELGAYIGGHIAKYSDEYMPRAFGDAMQSWGVSTILIESGGWRTERDAFLQKMNFIALLTAFDAIAGETYQTYAPVRYDELLLNDKQIYDLIIKDVGVFDGTGIPPFVTDVAINFDPQHTNPTGQESVGRIAEMGDLTGFAALDTIDGQGLFLMPGMVAVISDYTLNAKRLHRQLRDLLRQGNTTVLISLEFTHPTLFSRFGQALATEQFTGNVGTLLELRRELRNAEDSLQVLRYLKDGFVGLIASDSLKSLQLAEWLGKPYGIYCRDRSGKQIDPEKIQLNTSVSCTEWRIPQRGSVRIGQVADLVVCASTKDGLQVRQVFIKGQPVYREGNWLKPVTLGERWMFK